MSKQFVEQYTSIQTSINGNLQTIKDLLRQTQKLYDIAGRLDENDENDKEIKTEIVAEIDKMQGTIDQLISQTEVLFKAYKRAYELAFSNA